jgi:hypothetical protein
MSQITKSLNLSGYRLSKEDIEQLCECLAEGVMCERLGEGITTKSDITLSFDLKDRVIRKDATEELFADTSIPPVLHNLHLSCSGYSSSCGYRSVAVSLWEGKSSLQVVGNNEVWVEGKCQQIKNFLSPRESRVRHLFGRFGGFILYSLLITISLVLSTSGNTTAGGIVLMLGLVALIMFVILDLHIVPMNVIYLRDAKESWLKRNASTWLAYALAAAIGAIITFLLTKLFG